MKRDYGKLETCQNLTLPSVNWHTVKYDGLVFAKICDPEQRRMTRDNKSAAITDRDLSDLVLIVQALCAHPRGGIQHRNRRQTRALYQFKLIQKTIAVSDTI